MPAFIYTGRASRLVLAGRTLVRGRTVELDGRAADAAAAHSDVVDADEAPADLQATLEAMTVPELRELAEANELDTDGLKADLVDRLLAADAEVG